jgi:hypothetical protein
MKTHGSFCTFLAAIHRTPSLSPGNPNVRCGDWSVPLIAGFRLGVLLCCRALADPLRTHLRGVRRDIEHVLNWLGRSSEEEPLSDESF